MPYNSELEVIQWAREAVNGTDLAATSKILGNVFNFKPQDSIYRPDVMRGLLQRYRGFETPVKRWTAWDIEGDFTYEQAQNWFNLMIANVAAPTGAGPYTWVHTRNPAAIPALATATFERQESDGSTPINQAWHYGLGQVLTLTGADGEPIKYKASGVARRIQSEALTGALSLPTPELEPMALSKVFIDTTWAGLGGTQVASQALGWSLEWHSGAVPLWTADARPDLDYTLHGIDPKQTYLTVKLLLLMGAQFSIEKTAAEAASLRAVRLQFDGTSSRSMKLDFLAKHTPGSLFELGEQDGQKVVELNLVESSDGTNLFSATLINNIATLT